MFVALQELIEVKYKLSNWCSKDLEKRFLPAALPTNVRLGLKYLPQSNALAYYCDINISARRLFQVHVSRNV